MKSALRHLAWTLPALALLAGCNGGESAKPEPHAVATYAPATWKDLPAVSDEDLLAGFYAWRNGCEKLKRDPVWAATCEAAGSATASAARAIAQLFTMLSHPYPRQTGAAPGFTSAICSCARLFAPQLCYRGLCLPA